MKLDRNCTYQLFLEEKVKNSRQPPWGKPTVYVTPITIVRASFVSLEWYPLNRDYNDLLEWLGTIFNKQFFFSNRSYYGVWIMKSDPLGIPLHSYTSINGDTIHNIFAYGAYENPNERNHNVLLSVDITSINKVSCIGEEDDEIPDNREFERSRDRFSTRFSYEDNRQNNRTIKFTYNNNRGNRGNNNVSFNGSISVNGNFNGGDIKQNNNFSVDFNRNNNRFEFNNNSVSNYGGSGNTGGNGINEGSSINNTINNISENNVNNEGDININIPLAFGFLYAPIELAANLRIPIELPNGEFFVPDEPPVGEDIDEHPEPDPGLVNIRIDVISAYTEFIGLKYLTPQNRTYPEIGWYAFQFEDGHYSEWLEIREERISLLIPETAINLVLSYTNGRYVQSKIYKGRKD